MLRRSGLLHGLVGLLALAVSTANGQDYQTKPPTPYGMPADRGPSFEPPAAKSDWMAYPRPAYCCGPVGGHGPIGTELYLRSGVSFPIAGGVYRDALNPGWVIQGGGRVLLFDPPQHRAWYLDLSISNIRNDGQDPATRVPLSILVQTGTNPITNQPIIQLVNFGQGGVPGVGLRDLNRTFVNAAVGRFAYFDGWLGDVWRIGVDVGGRWGAARGSLEEAPNRTGVIYGAFVGFQLDASLPVEGVRFDWGIRGEYSYTWMDILQANNADLQDLNLLLNVGVHY